MTTTQNDQQVQIMDITMKSAMDTPKRTPAGQGPTVSVVTVQTGINAMVLMEDRGTGCSITNGAEQICRMIHDELLHDMPYRNIRWVYRDTDREVSEIVTNGFQADFKELHPNDQEVISAWKIASSQLVEGELYPDFL